MRAELIAFIAEHPKCTEDQIREAVTGKALRKREILMELVTAGTLTRAGTGRRGDPFLYGFAQIPVEGAQPACEPVEECV